MSLKPPYSRFGGKREVADVIWKGFGVVNQYVEPCYGGGAVHLSRPLHFDCVEVINDVDLLLVNFWRSLKLFPEQVIEHAIHPSSEVDLIARNNWLHNTRNDWKEKFCKDPEFCQPKYAGWWVWGASIWLGHGFCDRVVKARLPTIGQSGRRGILRGETPDISKYLNALSFRLVRTQIACGDWSRVLTPGATTMHSGGKIAVFLDPPYAVKRTSELYSHDDEIVSRKVRRWAIDNGDDSKFRIVLAGYVEEHDKHMPIGWRRHFYAGPSSYQSANSAKEGKGNNENRRKECLWFSPHCVPPRQGLFANRK